MTAGRVRNLRNALAVLAGVTRHEDDPHTVRIRITTPDGEETYGSLCLSLLPLTELVDAVRARAADIARSQHPAQPAAQSALHLIRGEGVNS
jgi:hypothetical protein